MNARAMLHYEEGFANIARVVGQASDLNRLAAFALVAREPAGWVKRGDMRESDVVERLRVIGASHGLGEVEIQDAIDTAFQEVETPLDTDGLDFAPTTKHARVHPSASSLIIRRASEIRPESVNWLWPGRMAIGKTTLIAGEPGLGKSQLTCAIGAAVSTAGAWPCGEGRAPLGNVIIFSAEDGAADTIRPRLDAAGADVDRVHIATAVCSGDGSGRRSFNLQADLALLEKVIDEIRDVRLVVIDPVSSYLGKVDSHKNAELRAVLEPIGDMAARLSVSVLAVTHLNKGGGGPPNSRIMGSIAFVAAARAAFIVARDPDDDERCLLLPTKNNLGPEGTGLGFRVRTQTTASGIVAPSIEWDPAPVHRGAADVLAWIGTDQEKSARDEAEDFLQSLLAEGARPVTEIKAEAREAGLSQATIRRAKARLGIRANRIAVSGSGLGPQGRWLWNLPSKGLSDTL